MPNAATLTSVEGYLSTSYKPACDFIDGVPRRKSMSTKKHSRVQNRIGALIFRDYPQFDALPELTSCRRVREPGRLRRALPVADGTGAGARSRGFGLPAAGKTGTSRDGRSGSRRPAAVKIRPGKYLVPDLAVMGRDAGGDPYPTEPVYLWVEILSPDDRMGQAIAKCEEDRDWGVEYTWIVDPVEERAWEYHRGRQLAEVTETLSAGEISVSCAEVFL